MKTLTRFIYEELEEKDKKIFISFNDLDDDSQKELSDSLIQICKRSQIQTEKSGKTICLIFNLEEDNSEKISKVEEYINHIIATYQKQLEEHPEYKLIVKKFSQVLSNLEEVE